MRNRYHNSVLTALTSLLVAVVLFGCSLPFGESKNENDSNFVVENGVLVKYKGPIVHDLVVPAAVNGQTVTTIGSDAFSESYGSHVTLSAGVTTIERGAFASQLFLDVDLPSTLTTIGDAAFASSSLTAVDIPDGVTTIGERAFAECRWLNTVELPQSLTSIAKNAFSGCVDLLEVSFPSGLTTIGPDAFSGDSSLISISLPDTVQEIGDEAFADCSHLAIVSFSSALTTIGQRAFYRCDLGGIDLPSGVSTMGVSAFEHNSTLEAAHFRGSGLTSINSTWVFSYTKPGLTLYVPAASVDAYRASWGTSSESGLTDSQIVSE